MDVFGPSVSLFPMNGIVLDLSVIFTCNAAYNHTSSITISENTYFILANFTSTTNSPIAYTYMLIMKSSDSTNVIFTKNYGEVSFQFTDPTSLTVKALYSLYSLTVSLIRAE